MVTKQYCRSKVYCEIICCVGGSKRETHCGLKSYAEGREGEEGHRLTSFSSFLLYLSEDRSSSVSGSAGA